MPCRGAQRSAPMCVRLSSAPVALRRTRMSFELARRMSGMMAPALAMRILLSSAAIERVVGRRPRRRTAGGTAPGRTVGCEIGDGATGVTLDLDARRGEQVDERWQCAHLHDCGLVLVHSGQIAEGRRCGALHFNVARLRQRDDRLQRRLVRRPRPDTAPQRRTRVRSAAAAGTPPWAAAPTVAQQRARSRPPAGASP